MLVYQGTTEDFVSKVRSNTISDVMCEAFLARFGHKPHPSEIASWQNSLPKVRDLIELAGLTDNMIALEYEVPYNQSRIDCLLFGRSLDSSIDTTVLLELKQWTRVKALPETGNFEDPSVETYTGGNNRTVAHPSQQVKGYEGYLKNFIAEFSTENPLTIFSCAYCHNYDRVEGSGLFDPIYETLLTDYPVFSKSDTQIVADKIKLLLSGGKGFEVFNRFMQSPVRPSQKLLENVSKIISNEVTFSLLNEQLVAKNLIWAKVRRFQKERQKSVVVVRGGPGTGKSVIAVNLLAEAAQKNLKVFYACKSKPFIEGLKKLVGRDGAMLFSNLYRFLPSRVEENELDLLLIDEAHRIEKSSNHQYTKKEDRTDMPQLEQLIRSAKTTVFFIDDFQNVRSQEIGSTSLLEETANKWNCDIAEVQLETQFRCMGSNNYLQWVESLLGYSSERRVLTKNEIFDFQIMESPEKLYAALAEKELQKSNSARMVAGFCWPWSKDLDSDGDLVKDVRIGSFALPWETHGDITRPPKGYVKWYEWAYRPEGFKQVGCIYTAQGFEFDYIGVIIGDDLIFDTVSNTLTTNIKATCDPTLKRYPDNFDRHVRNIYRTLLTRGMKGCYVYFTNKETERYFKAHIES